MQTTKKQLLTRKLFVGLEGHKHLTETRPFWKRLIVHYKTQNPSRVVLPNFIRVEKRPHVERTWTHTKKKKKKIKGMYVSTKIYKIKGFFSEWGRRRS